MKASLMSNAASPTKSPSNDRTSPSRAASTTTATTTKTTPASASNISYPPLSTYGESPREVAIWRPARFLLFETFEVEYRVLRGTGYRNKFPTLLSDFVQVALKWIGFTSESPIWRLLHTAE